MAIRRKITQSSTGRLSAHLMWWVRRASGEKPHQLQRSQQLPPGFAGRQGAAAAAIRVEVACKPVRRGWIQKPPAAPVPPPPAWPVPGWRPTCWTRPTASVDSPVSHHLNSWIRFQPAGWVSFQRWRHSPTAHAASAGSMGGQARLVVHKRACPLAITRDILCSARPKSALVREKPP